MSIFSLLELAGDSRTLEPFRPTQAPAPDQRPGPSKRRRPCLFSRFADALFDDHGAVVDLPEPPARSFPNGRGQCARERRLGAGCASHSAPPPPTESGRPGSTSRRPRDARGGPFGVTELDDDRSTVESLDDPVDHVVDAVGVISVHHRPLGFSDPLEGAPVAPIERRSCPAATVSRGSSLIEPLPTCAAGSSPSTSSIVISASGSSISSAVLHHVANRPALDLSALRIDCRVRTLRSL